MSTPAVEKLNQFAVIVAEGSDAQTFLQGQLTNSLQSLTPEHHQRTGYCSAKGRLLAIAQAWIAGPDRYALLLPTEIATSVCKRLSMYVLRAKVRLSVVPAEISGAGTDTDRLVEGALRQTEADEFWLGMPPCPHLGARALRVRIHVPQEGEASDARWSLADIRSGSPWIWAATQDLFVPQMVNLELLSGVDFKKGCYPGQEIVARSQYLGKLNRRMFGLEWTAGSEISAPGSAVWGPTDPEQPCGTLVSVADDPAINARFGLVSISLDAWAEGNVHGLRIGSVEGPVAKPFALPYPVPTSPQTPNRPKL